jgi:molybdopterin/thiamine biosynthesis adenylyltransferase
MSIKLYLKKEVQLLENSNGELKIRLGNKVSFSIFKNKTIFKNIFKALEVGISYNDIIDKFDLSNTKVVRHILRFFTENYFLTEKEYYGLHDRQIRYFSLLNYGKEIDEFQIQNSIYKSSILIAGLGGIGTHVASCLASSGISRIGLCDYDIIEESNLSRCIGFTKNDIGSLKNIVLANFLSNLYPDTLFETHSNKIQEISIENLIKYDFIIISIDKSVKIENELNTLFSNIKIPYIFSNYGNQYGMISKINQSLLKTNNQNKSDDFELINIANSAPSVYWNSMIIAGITCKEVLAYLTKGMASYSQNFRINMNLDDFSINLD